MLDVVEKHQNFLTDKWV